MPSINDILDFENGEMDMDRLVEFFQSMIDSGIVWQLQGFYGRTANALIETRRNHDIQFFRNSMSVISDFGKTQEFANLGEVEHNLANNYIGTDKLLSRINS